MTRAREKEGLLEQEENFVKPSELLRAFTPKKKCVVRFKPQHRGKHATGSASTLYRNLEM